MQTLVLAPHDKDEYRVANIIKEDASSLLVAFDNGDETSVATKDVFRVNNPATLESTDDMTKLEELHQSVILNNLRRRWKEENIYTYIGPMIVSVNPHKKIDRYEGNKLIYDYLSRDKEELEPHLFAMAKNAYFSLKETGVSQSIIISGESGSGKTEATKIILNFLTEASKSEGKKDELHLAERIQATNPIMESFGNAKTTRNNNSSRFGKFIKIIFDGTTICGAEIDNYLLEKTRVISQAQEERNYHIFYQIINYTSEDQRQKYRILSDAKQYQYMSNGNLELPNSAADYNDKKEFEKVMLGFKTLEFTPEEVDNIFSILSSILWLGNFKFEESSDGYAFLPDQEALVTFCDLLGFLPKSVKDALTKEKLTIGLRVSANVKSLGKAKAIEYRDAFAKALYAGLFDWLVQKLNNELKGKPPPDSKFIGVLDIYGFEDFKPKRSPAAGGAAGGGRRTSAYRTNSNTGTPVFQRHSGFGNSGGMGASAGTTGGGAGGGANPEPKNSIEQFLINFANEKLHQRFIHHMFQSEQEEYEKEGVSWQKVNCADNLGCIQLVEKIIILLRDKMKVAKVDDSKIAQEIIQLYNKNQYFVKPDNEDGVLAIGIGHYAGPVIYNLENWLEKNGDNLSADIINLMNGSSNNIVRSFYSTNTATEEVKNSPKAVSDMKGGKPAATAAPANKRSVCEKFKDDLNRLVDVLGSCDRHYARCLKPNDNKSSTEFNSQKIMQQLKCNGVFETVTLRKHGFSQRMNFQSFEGRFWVCLSDSHKGKEGLTRYLSSVLPSTELWAMGHTKVFLKDKALDILTHEEKKAWGEKTVKAQSFIRMYHQVTLFQRAKENIKVLQAIYRRIVGQRNYKVARRRVIFIQNFVRTSKAMALLRAYELEYKQKVACATLVQSLVRRNQNIELLQKLIYEAWKLRMIIRMQGYCRGATAKLKLEVLIEEERKRQEEERRRLEEERKRLEEEKKRQEEEKRRQEEEKKRQEEKKRAEEEEKKRKEEQLKRIAELKLLDDAMKLKALEEERKEEERKEEERKKEEERRKEEERKKEEERRKEEEKKQQELKQKEEERKKQEEEREQEERKKQEEEEEEEGEKKEVMTLEEHFIRNSRTFNKQGKGGLGSSKRKVAVAATAVTTAVVVEEMKVQKQEAQKEEVQKKQEEVQKKQEEVQKKQEEVQKKQEEVQKKQEEVQKEVKEVKEHSVKKVDSKTEHGVRKQNSAAERKKRIKKTDTQPEEPSSNLAVELIVPTIVTFDEPTRPASLPSSPAQSALLSSSVESVSLAGSLSSSPSPSPPPKPSKPGLPPSPTEAVPSLSLLTVPTSNNSNALTPRAVVVQQRRDQLADKLEQLETERVQRQLALEEEMKKMNEEEEKRVSVEMEKENERIKKAKAAEKELRNLFKVNMETNQQVFNQLLQKKKTEWEEEEKRRRMKEHLDLALFLAGPYCTLTEQEKIETQEFLGSVTKDYSMNTVDYLAVLLKHNATKRVMLSWEDLIGRLTEYFFPLELAVKVDKALERIRVQHLKSKGGLSVTVSLSKGEIIIHPKASKVVHKFTNIEMFARIDSRVNRESLHRIHRFKTKCFTSPILNWDPVINFDTFVPSGWCFWLEICEQTWSSDDLLGETFVSWDLLRSTNPGPHWLTLKYIDRREELENEYLMGHYAGEILVDLSGFESQPIQWKPDIIKNYLSTSIKLMPDATYFTSSISATLVRHVSQPSLGGKRVGVLFLHDFSDYFWQGAMGDRFVEELGVCFYALDLRKYGRSRAENARLNSVENFMEYSEEINWAIGMMKAEKVDKIFMCGLGLGAAIASIYVSYHPNMINGIILLSPLLDPHNSILEKTFLRAKSWLGGVDVSVKDNQISFALNHTLHTSEKGEWDWDLTLKPLNGFPVYAGWIQSLDSILQTVLKRPSVDIPALLLVSDKCYLSDRLDSNSFSSDVIIDPKPVVPIAKKLFPQTEVKVIENAIHDIFHSAKGAREDAYNALSFWLHQQLE